jgi:hypothetical protein
MYVTYMFFIVPHAEGVSYKEYKIDWSEITYVYITIVIYIVLLK